MRRKNSNSPSAINQPNHHHQRQRRYIISSSASTSSKIKLDLSSSSGRFGENVRVKEFQALQEIYFQVQQPKATTKIVLISGGSGTGKTFLCHQLKEYIRTISRSKTSDGHKPLCLFGEGKFDQYQHLSGPFFAIIRAFTDICEQLLHVSHLQDNRKEERVQSSPPQATETSSKSGDKKTARKKNGSFLNDISDDIQSALEGEANVRTLIQLIPALAKTLQPERPDNEKDLNQNIIDLCCGQAAKEEGIPKEEPKDVDATTVLHSEFNTTRIMSLFRSLLKGICRPTRPVVLFLDDIMWADLASRQLIHTILADDEICNFLFLGTTRESSSLCNNMPSSDNISAASTPQNISNTSQESTIVPERKAPAVVEITLNNLDVSQVNQMLNSILQLHDADKTNELSSVIMRKTEGIMLFVIQFLELLSRENLIFFAMDRGEWSWDINSITARTDVSENVAEFLVSHVQEHIPGDVRIVLSMAACLGYSFDSKRLLEILQQEEELEVIRGAERNGDKALVEPIGSAGSNGPASEQQAIDIREWLNRCLKYAVEGKFIEVVSPDVYKFSHDQVQQCFYGIMSSRRDIELLHLRIGRIVRDNYHDQSSIFLAVDQMNRGTALVDTRDERLDLIRLNIAACHKARSLSAFLPAALYLKSARGLVTEGDWSEQYELLLELFLLSAETEYSCGNHQDVMTMVDEVLKHAQNLKDMARAFYVRVGSLGTQSRYMEATKEACRVLKLLGEPIPIKPGPLRVVYEFIKTRHRIGRRTTDELRSLPKMHGWKNGIIMKFMVLADLFSTLSQQKNLQAVLFFRQVQHTLKYGLTAGAGSAFANYGIILAIRGNHAMAYDFGRLALAVAEDWQDDSAIAAAYLAVYGYVNHFRQPLFNALDPLLTGYRVGIESDTVEFASFCLLLYLELYLVMGLPLKPYLEDVDRFLHRLEEIKQEAALLLSLPSRDFARAITLLPSKENPLSEPDRKHNFDVVKPTRLTFEMYLAYLKGDLEEANETLLALSQVVDPASSRNFLFAYLYRLVDGLVSYGMYRLHRKKNYWERAKDAKHWFKRLAKDGDVNAFCMLLLLHAEAATFRKSMNDTRKLFDQAIVSLSQGGFVAFAAIANERAGDSMVKFRDAFWAGHYYRKALKMYKDWGAVSKVNQITALVAEDPDRHNETSMLSLRGRARFDDVHVPNSSLDHSSFVRSQTESIG